MIFSFSWSFTVVLSLSFLLSFLCHYHYQSSNLIISCRSYFSVFLISLQSLLFPIHFFYASRFILLKYLNKSVHCFWFFLKSNIHKMCPYSFTWPLKFSKREFLPATLVQEPYDPARLKYLPFSNDALFLLHSLLFPCCLSCIEFSLHHSSVNSYPSFRLVCLFHLVDFPDHSRSC